MHCAHCDAENTPEARFCSMCAHPLPQLCPKCQQENPPEARFCSACATPLQGSDDTSDLERLDDLRELAPEGLQEKIRQDPRGIPGQRKPVTILFTDIVGSTAIAEKLDPEEWKEVVQGAHKLVSEAVYRYEGTIAQLLGDGVLAFFGAPLTHEDDPERAVRAALDIQASMTEYRSELSGFVDDFQMRVGINTGEVVIGEVGSEEHVEYLAVGDAVNIAARLEGVAEPGQILVSEAIARRVEAGYNLRDLGEVPVKGKAAALAIFELIEAKAEPSSGRGIEGLRAPLVGRDSELMRLRLALDSLQQGLGQIVVVLGDAGIGKTRLVQEAIEQVEQTVQEESSAPSSSLRWLEGRSLSYGSALSFWPMTQLILADLGLSDGDAEVKVKAALRRRVSDLLGDDSDEFLPFLFHILGLKQDDAIQEMFQTLDGETVKHQIKKSIRRYFTRMAEREPTVLCFEDTHWADPSSLEILEDLFSATDQCSLMLLILMRVERDHGSWKAKLQAETDFGHRYTEINLKRLSKNDSNKLVDHLLEVADLPDDVRRLMMDRSEGNPFYLEEIIRNLIDQGVLVHEGATWRATKEIAQVSIPDSLHGVLQARIDRLGEDVRRTLQLAAVIGKSFLYRILESITEAERELDVHLAQLQRVDLVREKTRRPELEYIFKHSLTQEAAYNSLLVERRREFHRKVGEAIEQLFADRVEDLLGLLAHHFHRAEELEKAADYLMRASWKAFGEGAIKESMDYAHQALNVYERLEDPLKIGRVKARIGTLLWGLGDRQASLDMYEEALEILENQPDSVELAGTLSLMSRMYMLSAEHEQAISMGERALEMAERFQDEVIRINTLNTVGCSLGDIGDEEQGYSYIFKSLQLSLELNDPRLINRAYFNLVEGLMDHSRNQEARELAQDYIQFAYKLGNRFVKSQSFLKLLPIDWLGGHWKTALDYLPEIEKLVFGIWQIWANHALVVIDNDLGCNDEARDRLERMLDGALKTGEIQTVAPYLGELIRSFSALGLESKTDDYVEMLIHHVGSTPFYNIDSVMPLLHACYWTLMHRKRVALKNGEVCVSRINKAYQQQDVPMIKAALAEAQGCLALAKDLPDQASAHFREAVEIWEEIERPYDQLRAFAGLGKALMRINEKERAAQVLDQAMGIVTMLADQLEDEELKESFLSSQLVRQIKASQTQL
ncbi:MAG: ATP-binding protein, partial [Anaerolineales bacterium]